MTDNRNTILAIILSGLVLIGWQYFFNIPQMEKQRAAEMAAKQQQTQQQVQPQAQPGTQAGDATPAQPGGAPSLTPGPAVTPGGATLPVTREAAIAASSRIRIETPHVTGSIALQGARIDDLALTKYRETVDPKSPAIVLFSPSGSPQAYYAEFGFVGASGSTARLPDQNTVWTQQGAGALTPATPITLTYDNDEGLTFRRSIAIDDNYLFTVQDSVSNNGSAPVTLYPFGLVSRHGTPQTSGYYILHEGFVGVLGDKGLQEYSYSKLDEQKVVNFSVTNGWLGITDKYWAAALLPATDAELQARYSANPVAGKTTYQADYLQKELTVAPGATTTVNSRLFAGAKEANVVGVNFPLLGLGGYNETFGLNHFDLLIDWGWFYMFTKPMFLAIDWLFRVFGNFGVAILLVTVLVKAIFYPLANKAYASMAKMKAMQPQLTALRERYPDDKLKQQQEMMAIYKREKINPVAGCLPILIQIPVFFALYKVLFVTIEMRHAPFFGWIQDLSAPDPTNLFNLFGLLPFDPTHLPVLGPFLMLGIWPIIMGITMWVQMKLNPTPPDPTQKMIFDWMPVIFTFMLAAFPAGLVIYWAWNNLLSVLQQGMIMRRNGVKIELFDNIKSTFGIGTKAT